MKVINLFLAFYAIVSFASAILRPAIVNLSPTTVIETWSDSIHKAFDTDAKLQMKQKELEHRVRMTEIDLLNLKLSIEGQKPISYRRQRVK